MIGIRKYRPGSTVSPVTASNLNRTPRSPAPMVPNGENTNSRTMMKYRDHQPHESVASKTPSRELHTVEYFRHGTAPFEVEVLNTYIRNDAAEYKVRNQWYWTVIPVSRLKAD